MNETNTKQTILVVDDTPVNIDVIKTALADSYFVQAAIGGEMAFKIMDKKKPDLILLDIMMPGMDGYEVCKRLKENTETAAIPIIFLTAKSEVADETKGLGLGAVDYITKPFSIPIVQARVHTHLQMRAFGQQLENQNQTLRELNKLKNEFIGMAAHDLRNPLGAISGFAQLLIDHDDITSEESKEYLLRIESTATTMLALVSNLLDISVIESGNLKLKMEKGSLEHLCLERVQIIALQAKKKEITLHAFYNKIGDFNFDKNHISQVLDNLLSNAVKFSPLGSQVHISLEQGEGMVKISIRDEGPGISEADRDRIFGSFQKLSARPTGGEKSTGLGLAITKKIIEAHQGTIGITTGFGKGSTFSFSIPIV